MAGKARKAGRIGVVLVLIVLFGMGGFLVGRLNTRDHGAGPATSDAPTASSATSSGPSGAVSPVKKLDAAQVDRGSAEAVARGAVQIMSTWDTSTDSDEAAALQRARELMNGEAAEKLPESGTEDQFRWPVTAEQKSAVSSPEISDYPISTNYADGQRRPAGAGSETKEYRVDWWWVGADGSQARSEQRRIYTVTVVNVGGRWSVAQWSYRPAKKDGA